MADEIRAVCGVLCSPRTCEVFKATVTNDDELRRRCFARWQEIANEHWGVELRLEDLNCRGCILSDDAVFAPKYCPIADCAKKKGYSNCGRCPGWKACGWLANLHKDCPEAREYLLSQQ